MYHEICTWQDIESEPCTGSRDTKKDPSNFLTKEELLSVMARYFRTTDFVLDDYKFEDVTGSYPMSFKGEHWKLEVAASNSLRMDKSYRFLVKRLQETWTYCYESLIKTRAFSKEVQIYSTMFEDFIKAQNDLTLHQSWCPSYFYSVPGEILVLEYPKDKGYLQVERRECLDKEHLLAVLRSLASLHAATFKFERSVTAGTLKPKAQNFGKVNAHGKVTAGDVYGHLDLDLETPGRRCHPENIYLEACVSSQLSLVDLLPGFSASELAKIKAQLPELLRKASGAVKSSKKYCNAFIHGNLSVSNMFFRKKSDRLDAILVDYQNMRYAPPAHDLLMLLFLNQSTAFRIKEMQPLIHAYYKMFSEELGKNDISVHTVLTMRELQDSCEELMEWARLSAAMQLQVLLLPDEAVRQYFGNLHPYNTKMMKYRNDVIAECFSKDPLYRTRMIEALTEVIRFCVKL